MKREIVVKFSQEIPPEYIENRKSLKEASIVLIEAIREVLNFDGDIKVTEMIEKE